MSKPRLFIIRRDHHPELYRRTLRAFRGTCETQVICDRRLGQRRGGGRALAAERGIAWVIFEVLLA